MFATHVELLVIKPKLGSKEDVCKHWSPVRILPSPFQNGRTKRECYMSVYYTMVASSSSPQPGSGKDDIQHISVPSISNTIKQFSTSGIAVSVATGVTHPIDVVKVRLQMEYVGQRGPLTGMTKTFVKLIKYEGPLTLYSGLAPALVKSFVYGGLRLGLYEPCKYASDSAFGHTSIVTKFASGAISGSLATALTNPSEILKVRLQMKKGSGSKGSVHELSQIVAAEGVAGLWKGVGPAMARAAALRASQLATYDESKQALIRWTSLEEGFFLHLRLYAVQV